VLGDTQDWRWQRSRFALAMGMQTEIRSTRGYVLHSNGQSLIIPHKLWLGLLVGVINAKDNSIPSEITMIKRYVVHV
jgi:hypothetical protein